MFFSEKANEASKLCKKPPTPSLKKDQTSRQRSRGGRDESRDPSAGLQRTWTGAPRHRAAPDHCSHVLKSRSVDTLKTLVFPLGWSFTLVKTFILYKTRGDGFVIYKICRKQCISKKIIYILCLYNPAQGKQFNPLSSRLLVPTSALIATTACPFILVIGLKNMGLIPSSHSRLSM